MYLLWRKLIVVFSCCQALALEYIEPTVIQLGRQDSTVHLSEPVAQKEMVSHNISIIGDQFVLDGESLYIMSGSLHYFRLPAAYWRDRLQKFKAAGLNSVATYVEWSYHEPEERQYVFDGDRDIVKFIKTAAEEGLHVLLRVGPYICAERDLGGLPYWLLGKYPNIKLRSTDQDFIEEARIWVAKLFEQVSPLLFGNGGPIILVQVENEYGSYDSDMVYKEQMRDILLEHVGTNALLYTTDGPQIVEAGMIPNVLATIDFGVTAQPKSQFDTLIKKRPSPGPLMNSEFYPGWLTHWGERMAQINTDQLVTTLRAMLENKINVNFYVFFGGSNFEFTSGANFDGTYQPDITSYDYDAPLTEAGDPTPKYYAIRETLKQFNMVNVIDPPVPSPKGTYGTVTVSSTLSLLSTKGRSQLGKQYNDVSGSVLPTFEYLRQRAGFLLYETTLSETDGTLVVNKPSDMVFVFVDGVAQGVISRMRKNYRLRIKSKPSSTLSLLVENQGRINYGALIHDRKGILSEVSYNNKVLNGEWKVTGYPLQEVNFPNEEPCVTQGPTFYTAQFTLPEGQEPLDTFLDTTGWGKGYIWINGNNLGRYWPAVGPQVTLYVPGVWLRKAPESNLLQILELDKAPATLTVEFIDQPILNRTGSIHFWRYP